MIISRASCRVTGPLHTHSRPPTSHQTLNYTPDCALQFPGIIGIGERGGEGRGRGERKDRGRSLSLELVNEGGLKVTVGFEIWALKRPHPVWDQGW